MGTLQPIALLPRVATAYLAVSKRALSHLIRSKKIAAHKADLRTLVDAASLKAYVRTGR